MAAADLSPLPQADYDRLNPLKTDDLVLSYLAGMAHKSVSSASLARTLRVWGLGEADIDEALVSLAADGLIASLSNSRWVLSRDGVSRAASRFKALESEDWAGFAGRYFAAAALGFDAGDPAVHAWIGQAANFYAAALARLYALDLAHAPPRLAEVRNALVWRLLSARFPDLMSDEGPPPNMSTDGPARALFMRFCGVKRGTINAAAPALLRRVLDAPGARDPRALRRALVRAALDTRRGEKTASARHDRPVHSDVTGRRRSASPAESLAVPDFAAISTIQPAACRAPSQPSSTSTIAAPPDADGFSATIIALARELRTPKRQGGHFSSDQVAIAQLYDNYRAAEGAGANGMSLDAFKQKLWQAVRGGAHFHLSRLDIPQLMDDELRTRSATPTRAGDVVHFVVLD